MNRDSKSVHWHLDEQCHSWQDVRYLDNIIAPVEIIAVTTSYVHFDNQLKVIKHVEIVFQPKYHVSRENKWQWLIVEKDAFAPQFRHNFAIFFLSTL